LVTFYIYKVFTLQRFLDLARITSGTSPLSSQSFTEEDMPKRSSALSVLAGLAATGAAGIAVYVAAVRPWHRHWGATDGEVAREMPGDEMVTAPNFETTRAITIEARPEEVWPWLVQLGQGRGGFYSYDVLENMIGLDINSASQISPELQDLKVGDVIALMAEGDGMTVAEMVPNRHLVLFVDTEAEGPLYEVFRQASASTTWVFLLEAIDETSTRLIVRWRARWDLGRSPMSFLTGLVLDPMEFIMGQKMMRGIKERAEAAAARARLGEPTGQSLSA
jgi:hypothetical protein